ncbi:MAG: hypothetical protein N3G80_03695 [Candidatus Micrarchaeota archaeon]|nr:hypothetical protein [Candidatus Micrarchaeota archaeon]
MHKAASSMQKGIHYQELGNRKWPTRELKDSAESLFRIVDNIVGKLQRALDVQKGILISCAHSAQTLVDWQKAKSLIEQNKGSEIPYSRLPKREVPAAGKIISLLKKKELSIEDAKEILALSGEIVAQAKKEGWESPTIGYATYVHYKIRQNASAFFHLLSIFKLAQNCQLEEAHNYYLELKKKETAASKIVDKFMQSQSLLFFLEAFCGAEKKILENVS